MPSKIEWAIKETKERYKKRLYQKLRRGKLTDYQKMLLLSKTWIIPLFLGAVCLFLTFENLALGMTQEKLRIAYGVFLIPIAFFLKNFLEDALRTYVSRYGRR